MNWRNLQVRAGDKLAQAVTGVPCRRRLRRSGVEVSTRVRIIGERCPVGADVVVADTDFNALDPARRETGRDDIGCVAVDVGNDVFIGACAATGDGVRSREADAP